MIDFTNCFRTNKAYNEVCLKFLLLELTLKKC